MAKKIKLNKSNVGETTVRTQINKLGVQLNDASEKDYARLPVEQLKVSPHNDYALGDMEELNASVGAYGVLESLVVVGPMDDNLYHILSGQRRRQAVLNNWAIGNMVHKDSGLLALILPPETSELDQKIIVHITNRQRDYDGEAKREQVVKIYELLEEKKKAGEITQGSVAENVADFFGKEVRQIQRILAIHKKGIPELISAADEKLIKIESAAAIAQLVPDIQKLAVSDINSGKKINDIDIKTYKELNKQIKEPKSSPTGNSPAISHEELSISTVSDNPLSKEEKKKIAEEKRKKKAIDREVVKTTKANVTVNTAIASLSKNLETLDQTEIPTEQLPNVSTSLQDIKSKIEKILKRLEDESSGIPENV